MTIKFVLLLMIFVNILGKSVTNRIYPGNNACTNFINYFDANIDKNCFYNPDMFLESVSFLINGIKLLFIFNEI
jgi:hypothetical protein